MSGQPEAAGPEREELVEWAEWAEWAGMVLECHRTTHHHKSRKCQQTRNIHHRHCKMWAPCHSLRSNRILLMQPPQLMQTRKTSS
jgi:hypothetical protein